MKHLMIMVYGSLVVFASCTTPAVKNTGTTDTLAGKPVETKPKVTPYQAVLPGQTRVARVKTSIALDIQKLDVQLNRPWAITPLPDGRFLITSRMGTLHIVDAEGKTQKEVKSIPVVDSGGQGGLLDIALDPGFSANRMLYWSFSKKVNGKNLTAVAKGRLADNESKMENVQVIFQATPEIKSELHYGSRLQFDKDSTLFVSTGERFVAEGRALAQDLNAGQGKIFRITRDGKAATGNPFIGKAGARPEIWSYGHRNPQSLAIHPVTGQLWEAEFGPFGGDELNRIEAGKNYGWPVITYGLEYSGEKIGDGIQQKEGMEQPVYFWDPVISPSGMTFYAGDAIAEWKNNLFIGGLSSMHICRLVIENNKVVGEERLLEDKKERFRDIAYSNGMLFAVTDNGSLYRIRKK